MSMPNAFLFSDHCRRVRAELRSARQELGDVTSRYRVAASRVQQLEEQVAGAEQLRAKLNRVTAQVRAAATQNACASFLFILGAELPMCAPAAGISAGCAYGLPLCPPHTGS
mgnify:CR=1 FL=1